MPFCTSQGSGFAATSRGALFSPHFSCRNPCGSVYVGGRAAHASPGPGDVWLRSQLLFARVHASLQSCSSHLLPLDLPLFGEHTMVFPSYPSLEGQTGSESQSTAPCPLQKPRETTEEKLTAAGIKQLSLPNLPLPPGSAVPLRNVRDQSSRWEGGRGTSHKTFLVNYNLQTTHRD